MQACRKRGGRGAVAPPDFGRSEGVAGQRRRAALLHAPQIFRPCDMPVMDTIVLGDLKGSDFSEMIEKWFY